MAWTKNGTPTTLGSALDDMDITDLTAYNFNQFLVHSLAVSGTIKHNFQFDNNSNTDYARRRSNNGASDSTDTSQAQIEYNGDAAQDRFEIIYSCNINGEEKLQIHFDTTQGTAGAGGAPNRAEAVSKCDVTTNTAQYTRIDCSNTGGTGNFDTSSNLSALGSD
jgi:acyl CoA:acetate/3-ketoacid CoA transferase alpha subunit